MVKNRNSNLELLRIISMVLIVATHYVVHGFNINNINYSVNKYILDIIYLLGKSGVECFVLITGYFMINSNFTLKKLVRLLSTVSFYSICILILFCTVLNPVNKIGLIDIIKSIFPVIFYQYWFVTIYVVLMILSPFINMGIKSISRKTYRFLLLTLILMWSVIPTLFLINPTGMLGFNLVGWFITLYLIGGYIRKYVDRNKCNANKHFKVAIIFMFILLVSSVLFNYIGHMYNINGFLMGSRHFAARNSIITLIIAIELIIGFIKLKEKHNNLINIISSATFGVYLIHDNIYMRPYIWNSIFNNQEMYDSEYLIIHAIFAISIVYIICTFIDLMRQKTIEKIYIFFIDKYLVFVEKNIEKFLYSFYFKIKNKLYIYYNK